MHTFMNPKKDEENQQNQDIPYRYVEQTFTRKIHHFYICEPIEEATKYVDIFHRLQTSDQDETIHIHINSPGGYLNTGVQFINSMIASPAHIVCSLEAEASSLATLIFLSADEWYVHDNCFMMFHNYSSMAYGKGGEITAHVEASNKWIHDLARKIYTPFLTVDEIERVIQDQDLYIHTDGIRKRLNRMVRDAQKAKRAAAKAAKEAAK